MLPVVSRIKSWIFKCNLNYSKFVLPSVHYLCMLICSLQKQREVPFQWAGTTRHVLEIQGLVVQDPLMKAETLKKNPVCLSDSHRQRTFLKRGSAEATQSLVASFRCCLGPFRLLKTNATDFRGWATSTYFSQFWRLGIPRSRHQPGQVLLKALPSSWFKAGTSLPCPHGGRGAGSLL